MTADGVVKVSAFGVYNWTHEHLVAARRQTFPAACAGMSDAQVLGGNIDRSIHALRMVLYCYHCVDRRWHLLPPRSSFPLMLNLDLSAESRRLIVHDVQDSVGSSKLWQEGKQKRQRGLFATQQGVAPVGSSKLWQASKSGRQAKAAGKLGMDAMVRMDTYCSKLFIYSWTCRVRRYGGDASHSQRGDARAGRIRLSLGCEVKNRNLVLSIRSTRC